MSANHDLGQGSRTRPSDPFGYWEARYGEAEGIWSGNVNQALADSIADRTAGTALDLGAGEGGDSLWLAQRGWQVTAVDLSPTALARGEAAASRAGMGEAITWIAADLESWASEKSYDLVSACFLHSRVRLDRSSILRRASEWVAPGGLLLVVGHAEPPPWAKHADDPMDRPTPAEDLAMLGLGKNWTTLICEVHDRQTYSPDGEPATLRDGVLLVQREE